MIFEKMNHHMVLVCTTLWYSSIYIIILYMFGGLEMEITA